MPGFKKNTIPHGSRNSLQYYVKHLSFAKNF